MKYCKKCILSDNFFSVKIEENGLCNYCNENSANSTKVLDTGIKLNCPLCQGHFELV